MDVLRDFAKGKRNANPLCGEFGVYTQEDLDIFLTKVCSCYLDPELC